MFRPTEKVLNFNVLVMSLSKKIPLVKAIRKAVIKLGSQTEIFGADSNSSCLGAYFVDHFYKMPEIERLQMNRFISFCQSHKIKCLIPTRDGELFFWASQKRTLLKYGIHVMISDPETVEICLDKIKLFKTFLNYGLPVIKTSELIDEIKAKKYVVKERYGAGSKNIGINLDYQEAIQHAQKLSAPVFQPFIAGKESSVDLYVDLQGNIKGIIARSRDLVINGESQITTTCRNKNIEKMCSLFVSTLNFYGHVIIQLMTDKNENHHIIECNSRFGGASTLSLEAGLDTFTWFFLESLGKNINPYPFLRSKSKKRQIRYPEDLVVDL